MKAKHLRKLPRLAAGILLLVGFSGVAHADTVNRAYLKTYGSDVMSGGWFSTGTNCSTGTSSNYQDPNYSNATLGITADSNAGGILTYAKQSSGNSAGGSSSQYGAFAVGNVDGDSTQNGFYSAGAQAANQSTAAKTLTFSNTITGNWGGAFEGSVRQSNCIPDYYSKMPPSAPNTSSLNAAVASGSGIYSATAGGSSTYSLTTGAVTVPAGDKITIYVKGDVYISNNISYQAHDANSIPKFALVVTGSIYIDPAVTQLDGLYIAQPSATDASAVSADDGIIWTCHPNSTGALDYTYTTNCNSTLVVNGALIAKQVNFLRVKGDIGGANTSEDSQSEVAACTSNPSGCNAAEVINYTPEMVMGGGFFTAGGSSGATGLPVDSLISLPPVF